MTLTFINGERKKTSSFLLKNEEREKPCRTGRPVQIIPVAKEKGGEGTSSKRTKAWSYLLEGGGGQRDAGNTAKVQRSQ